MNEPVKILMVEDDLNLGFLLRENFASKGFHVHLSNDGEEGWKIFRQSSFDLILLDIMMPKRDGFSLAKMIRRENAKVPIIFLTAKNFEEDKIEGFTIGCDDYITKPFSARELQMRINAILKRTLPPSSLVAGAETKGEIQVGKYSFHYENRLLRLGEETRKLSTKEADLIRIFAENMNQLLNRSLILNRVWGNDDYFTAKSMDVYLTRIRKLLKADPSLEIQNIHGTGFRLIIK